MPNVFGCLSVKSRYLWGLQVFRVDCTKYVYFGGQVIAEKNSAGDWTDYIFANGQRIAKAEGLNRDLHIFGTTSASGQFAVFNFPNAAGLSGYTIRTGDTLHLTQGQPAGSKGGIVLSFTDGSNSNWSVKDQDGYYLNDDETQVPAHLRSIDLSSLAGKTISQVAVNQEGDTATGPWNVYYDYVSLTSTDGTVVPIYTGQTSSPLTVGSHSAGETGLGSKIDTNRGKATSVTDVTTYYVADHLGSSRLILSGNGYPVWSGVFLPYGQEWNPQMTMNNYKFTGDERDSESNLDHTWFRQYESTQGRWLSPDPHAGSMSLENPQSLNRYAYVSSPLMSTDPTGADPNMSAVPTDTCGGDTFLACEDAANHAPPGSSAASGGCYLMGTPTPCSVVSSAIGGGAAVQCPGNLCSGTNSDGYPVEFEAFAGGGSGYYTPHGMPGSAYYSPEAAGIAAALADYELGSSNKHEYNANVYKDENGIFSFSTPEMGPFCPYGCTWTPNYGNIPDDTRLVGSAHNHPPFGFGDTSFSENADISTYLNMNMFGYLATAPGNRVIMFNPSLYSSFMNGTSQVSPICVLQGPPQGIRHC